MPACPYLGLNDDSTVMLSETTPAHRCYATASPTAPSESHQAKYCLWDSHVTCQYYAADQLGGGELQVLRSVDTTRRGRGRKVAVLATATFTMAALILAGVFGAGRISDVLPRPVATAARLTVQPTSASTPTPMVEEALLMSIPTPGTEEDIISIPAVDTGLDVMFPTVTPAPTAEQINITPKSGNAGWWDSEATIQLGFDDSFLYAGSREGSTIIGAARFELDKIPRGAPILSAELQLTGVSDSLLNPTVDNTWLAQLISQQELTALNGVSFIGLYSAPASITFLPELRASDLAQGKVNRWELGRNERAWLQDQLLNGATSIVLRIIPTTVGAEDTLFGWDSGLGQKTQGNGPLLMVRLGHAPATPPPVPTREYVVATFTPVPENVLTVVAMQSTATAVARTTGTYTPVPYFLTPTPPPQNLATVQARAFAQELPAVVVETPTPANEATATSNASYATAVALTTGTFTPVPTAYVTPFVVAPSPLPENSLTAIARTATAQDQVALSAELQTPLPWNAVIGAYVVATPTPENVATAAARTIQATADAQERGPATPTPWHWLVITPTPLPLPTQSTPTPTLPVYISEEEFTPTPTSTLAPLPTETAPAVLPETFSNLIVFKTDRLGGVETFALNPETGELGKITREWVYRLAQEQLNISPDGKNAAIVKPAVMGSGDARREVLQVFVKSLEYGTETQITNFTRDSYDPAWSPTGEWIAFVSTDPGNDEIYRVSPDGAIVQRLTFNQFEWDKHPTWSPDGQQIVFFSNRETGRRQLWTMNADGSGQRNLTSDEFENWDPLWTR